MRDRWLRAVTMISSSCPRSSCGKGGSGDAWGREGGGPGEEGARGRWGSAHPVPQTHLDLELRVVLDRGVLARLLNVTKERLRLFPELSVRGHAADVVQDGPALGDESAPGVLVHLNPHDARPGLGGEESLALHARKREGGADRRWLGWARRGKWERTNRALGSAPAAGAQGPARQRDCSGAHLVLKRFHPSHASLLMTLAPICTRSPKVQPEGGGPGSAPGRPRSP